MTILCVNVKLLCSVFKTATYVFIPNTHSDLLCYRYMILFSPQFSITIFQQKSISFQYVLIFEPPDYKVTQSNELFYFLFKQENNSITKQIIH